MKTSKYFLPALLIGMMAAGCTEKEYEIKKENEGEKIYLSFRADVETPSTKSYLSGTEADAVRNIIWEDWGEGDSDCFGVVGPDVSNDINVFSYSALSGTFSGTAGVSNNYYALYPFSGSSEPGAATFSSDVFSLYIDRYQGHPVENINGYCYPMVGKASSGTDAIQFKNLMGILVLQIRGKGVLRSVNFSAADEESESIAVAGDATVDMTYPEAPTLVFSTDPADDVFYEVYASYGNYDQDGNYSPVTLSETTPTTVMMVLPPRVYPYFCLEIITSEGVMEIYNNEGKPLTIERSKRTTAGVIDFVDNSTEDLSKDGTSNCYMINHPGYYKLNAKVMGNGPAGIRTGKFPTESAIITPTPMSAKALWVQYEGNTSVHIENFNSNIGIDSEGYLRFSIEDLSPCNILVAVYDKADPEASEAKILWSWHLWITPPPLSLKWISAPGDRSFKIMDRNLGAASAALIFTPTSQYDYTSFGLYYQWGRKDPFPRRYNMSGVFSEVNSKTTIENTINNPTTFYFQSGEGSQTWESETTNYYLWGNPNGKYDYGSSAETKYSSDGTSAGDVVLPFKSIYDPCPVGYMVAPNETWANFLKSGNTASGTSDMNLTAGTYYYGFNFSSLSGHWFPCAGSKSSVTGESKYILSETNTYGGVWSSAPNNSDYGNAYFLRLHYHNGSPSLQCEVNTKIVTSRGNGYSVRCVTEESVANSFL